MAVACHLLINSVFNTFISHLSGGKKDYDVPNKKKRGLTLIFSKYKAGLHANYSKDLSL